MSNSSSQKFQLDRQARDILGVLVSHIATINSDDSLTCLSYKQAHEKLRLPLSGDTYGTSLQAQGLNSLAQWTINEGVPGITGFVVDQETYRPGPGYFKLFGRKVDDDDWWLSELKKARNFDWKKYLDSASAAQEDESWSDEELRAAVVAYLDMQNKSRQGIAFVKTQYYSQLSTKFGRTPKAFEYRMQNISYVLSLMGRDWLSGLKPAKNVGLKVATRIESLIMEFEGHPIPQIVGFEIAVRDAMSAKGVEQPGGNQVPQTMTSSVAQYQRSVAVKAWVLNQAKGICECCAKPAPFLNFDGSGYLEVHHVIRLADRGPDTIDNAVALCPNCHREMHFGERAKELVEKLYLEISRLERG